MRAGSAINIQSSAERVSVIMFLTCVHAALAFHFGVPRRGELIVLLNACCVPVGMHTSGVVVASRESKLPVWPSNYCVCHTSLQILSLQPPPYPPSSPSYPPPPTTHPPLPHPLCVLFRTIVTQYVSLIMTYLFRFCSRSFFLSLFYYKTKFTRHLDQYY